MKRVTLKATLFAPIKFALTLMLLVTGIVLPDRANAQASPMQIQQDSTRSIPASEDSQAGGAGATLGGNLKLQTSPAPTLSVPAGKSIMGAFGGNVAPLGATVGGAQDIGYTRQLINDGKVPSFIDFSPEGLYSEHDIPTPASDCDEKLCLSLGYGFAPAADTKEPAIFVHLGMASGIRPEEFRRPNLQLALVVDVSGSMKGKSIEGVQHGLRLMVEQLAPTDVVSIVTFSNDATLLLPPTEARDRGTILAAIENITIDGGTNIEEGMLRGFETLEGLKEKKGWDRRMILFTDAQPNIGRTDTGSFRELAARYAEKKISMTVIGIGEKFGQEIAYHVSQMRGGNFFFLNSVERAETIFGEEFDFMVTPLVYDLNVTIRTPKGLVLTDVYGLPGWKKGDPDAKLHVPTVFPSSNRGAIVLRYRPAAEGEVTLERGDRIADGELSYTDVDGKAYRSNSRLTYEGKGTLRSGMQYYTHEGMRTAVALTNIYFGLRDGCLNYTQGKKEEALDVIQRARMMVQIENLTMLDDGLIAEVEMLRKLEANISGESVEAKDAKGESEPVGLSNDRK